MQPLGLFEGGDREVSESFDLMGGQSALRRFIGGIEEEIVCAEFGPFFDHPLEFGRAHERDSECDADGGRRRFLHGKDLEGVCLFVEMRDFGESKTPQSIDEFDFVVHFQSEDVKEVVVLVFFEVDKTSGGVFRFEVETFNHL